MYNDIICVCTYIHIYMYIYIYIYDNANAMYNMIYDTILRVEPLGLGQRISKSRDPWISKSGVF